MAELWVYNDVDKISTRRRRNDVDISWLNDVQFDDTILTSKQRLFLTSIKRRQDNVEITSVYDVDKKSTSKQRRYLVDRHRNQISTENRRRVPTGYVNLSPILLRGQ